MKMDEDRPSPAHSPAVSPAHPPVQTAPRAILIAGPTASGKSALALELARTLDGVVINADALQVYDLWSILTARPGPEDLAAAPHRLYGHVSPQRLDYSVGHWLRETALVLEACRDENKLPIIVGGTGLCFRALTEGLAQIPPVAPAIRDAVTARCAQDGLAPLLAELDEHDPETAARIDRANPRRVMRAIEVLRASGIGMAAWAARTPPPLLPLDTALALVLTPEREILRRRIATRFEKMIAHGALEEVDRIMALGLPESAPSMQALGAAELIAFRRGNVSLEDACQAAVIATGQYAKRQQTWFRKRMAAWVPLVPGTPEALAAQALKILQPQR
ncbi:MAG: tRNA (adenosine(37)-N6)-dimethylallyltransferase MiaA [Neomegalonema sp.]|nr:tRNA (adenosine(37)-N6)-dimethylallyltransferase MiaA [Neomegalonema sp.]